MQIRITLNGCRYFFLAFITLFSLSACSRAGLLNIIIPHSGYTKYSHIAYGTNPRQQVDIYIPENMSKPPATLLFFYGGSWQYGNKEDYRFVGQAFASEGFITVIADYRLYPSVYYPAFMEDTAKAFVWVHEHIRSYGGDPDNIFVAGHSAGGFNAMMLTVNPVYLQHAGGKLSWIRGTIGIAGPYDFLPFTEPNVKALFSKVDDHDTQPINFVGRGLPPILLLTGDADTEVFPKNAIHMYHKLQQFNDPADLIIYPKIGHIDIVLSLAYGFRSKAPTVEDISQFMRKQKLRVEKK
jgi:acetyl esterase/lipase